MEIVFYKYHGCGNDFVMIDNRNGCFNNYDNKFISKICDRKYGVGADGLILLENNKDLDFTMKYFNSDGSESGLCGNGARCITEFAKRLGIINNSASFQAIDGVHYSEILDENYVKVKMNDIDMSNYKAIDLTNDNFYLDNGSPHLVINSRNITQIDVSNEGKKIRYNKKYSKNGVNVNFIEYNQNDSSCKVRTYERGVEDETLSCGTGAVAVAIALNYLGIENSNEIKISMKGGDLLVSFNRNEDRFYDIWLSGDVCEVYKGKIDESFKR